MGRASSIAPCRIGAVEPFLPELDLSSRDPRHVEQVIDQPRQVIDLAVDDIHGPVELVLGVGERGHLDGPIDRGQRIPQLMRQHCQEFVLAAVGVGQFFEPLPQLLLAGLDSPPRNVQGLHDQRDQHAAGRQSQNRHDSPRCKIALADRADCGEDRDQCGGKQARPDAAVTR